MGAKWAKWVQMVGAGAAPQPPAGNLELFYDGDSVSYGSTVTATDLSGNGRDASQSTASFQPVAGTPLNGHGTVLHDGTNDRLNAVFGGGGFLSNDTTLVTLSQRPSATSSLYALFDTAPGTATNTGLMWLQFLGNREHRTYTGGGSSYAFSNTAWTVHIGTKSNTAVSVYEGTVLKNTNGSPAAATTQNNIRVGCLIQDVWFWDGSWAQILLYSRIWDSTDMANYIAYVNARYALSLV